MSQSTRIIKNFLALMSGQSFRVITSLVTVGLIARYLRLEGFGDYGFVMAVCSTVMVVTDMGINAISIREISRDKSKANAIFWASLVNRCLLGLAGLTITVITINFLCNERPLIMAAYFCAAAEMVFFLGDVCLAIFSAFEKMEYNALCTFVQRICYLLFVACVVSFDAGLNGIFAALLFSHLVGIYFGVLVLCRKFFMPKLNLDVGLCWYLIREGYLVGIRKILRKGSLRIDTIFIKLMRSTAEVGIFHGAYRVIIILLFMPRNLMQAFFPMFSRLSQDSKDYAHEVFQKYFKILLVVTIVIAGTLAIMAGDVIMVVFGKGFSEATTALRLFSLVLGIMFFNGFFISLLTAFDRQDAAAKAMGICLAVNVGLDLVLINLYGYLGAVVATFIAEVSLLAVNYCYIRKVIGPVTWLRTLSRPIYAAIPGVIVFLLFFQINSVVAAILSVIGYLISVFAFQVFESNEIMVIKKNIRKFRKKLLFLCSVDIVKRHAEKNRETKIT